MAKAQPGRSDTNLGISIHAYGVGGIHLRKREGASALSFSMGGFHTYVSGYRPIGSGWGIAPQAKILRLALEDLIKIAATVGKLLGRNVQCV